LITLKGNDLLSALPRRERQRIAGWVGWIVVVTLAFIQPLTRLMQHASQSDLHSYIPLVPFVAGYLLYLRRNTLPNAFRSSIAGSIVLAGIGALSLAAATAWSGTLSVNDGLGLITLAYVSVVAAGGFLLLGSRWMAAAAFPIGS
jgi:peptidoglycan/LPS O-acetylase OafA/YrhL